MKKKVLSILLTLLIILSNSYVTNAKESKITALDYSSTDKYVTDFAEKVFKYFMFDDEKIFDFELTETLKSYLINKKKVLNYNSSLYNLKKNEKTLKTELIEVNELNGKAVYTVNIKSDYLYADGQVDMSTIATNIIIKIDNNVNAFIVDNVFDEIGGFDIQIWTNESDELENISNDMPMMMKSSKLKKEKLTPIVLEEKAKELINKINEIYKEENKMVDKEGLEFKKANLAIPLRATRINKTAVKNYARNNYNKVKPASGGAGVPYFDFATIKESYDCTNFVSHALLAGGARPKYSSNGWYYRKLSDRTHSWSGVRELHDYLVNSSSGLRGKSYAYNTYRVDATSYFSDGDILQFKYKDKWTHSTIITGRYTFLYNGYPTYGALVTGRTSSGSNNNNAKAADVYGSNPKRIIRITGI
ncbi:amidase domain-containing protein [Helcococcus kunzii]|uniref:amidase domain-containing protein n=1 Tax=Helcococcus kunzii TaxID=40091 RepID=UPI001C957313|nr:amidase domain-containing protein [Helcococcus kunzii]QZO75992.1 amidase domain-containing protein [Helcococcus kunzii]